MRTFLAFTVFFSGLGCVGYAVWAMQSWGALGISALGLFLIAIASGVHG